jgi:TusA-related sulfurtransferase
MSRVAVDVQGMACSDAVLQLHKAIMQLKGGSTVVVRASDEAVLDDLQRYARRGGHGWGPTRRLESGTLEVEVTRAG